MIDAVELDAIEPMIELYREAKAKSAEWDGIAAQCRNEIESRLGESTVGTLGGAPAVKWSRVSSSRLDQTLVKSLHPSVYRECQTVSESRRFVLVDPA